MYRMTATYEVWDEQDGGHLEIGEDAEGLDQVEVRQYDENGEEMGALCFTPEQALMLGNAIIRYLKSREFLTNNPTGAVVKPEENQSG